MERVSLVVPNEITLIGRSQVHVFERARRLSGAVLRFGEAVSSGGEGCLHRLLASVKEPAQSLSVSGETQSLPHEARRRPIMSPEPVPRTSRSSGVREQTA
jgi:hypothetical protein